MSTKQAKRGRPAGPPDMTERFMIRCTPDDKARWDAAAVEGGYGSTGALVRKLVNDSLGKKKK